MNAELLCRLGVTTTIRVIPNAMLALLMGMVPASAQTHYYASSSQQHSNTHASHQHSSAHTSQPQPHYTPHSQNQMMNMLDQVETGKSAAPAAAQHPGPSPVAAQRTMGSLLGGGRGMQMRQGMMPGMNHPIIGGSMAAMGGMRGGGMGMAPGGMGMAPGGMGMAAGGGKGQLLQNLMQKVSTMRQQGGPQMSPQNGMRGSMLKPPGMAALGGGMGMGMGMQQMMQPKSSAQGYAPGSLLQRAGATTGGAGFPNNKFSQGNTSSGGTSSVSDLERQMDQQYGK